MKDNCFDSIQCRIKRKLTYEEKKSFQSIAISLYMWREEIQRLLRKED